MAPLWTAPPQRKQQRKPDIEIVTIASLRQEGTVEYEGIWRVTGNRPVTGLVIRLEFLDSGGRMVSAQSMELEAGTLQPGEEREFHIQGRDVPRAVRFRISVTDRKGRDLTIAGAGPYALG